MLFNACHSGDLGTIRRIVDSGFNIHTRNKEGETPLIYASRFESAQTEQVIQLLISKGSDLSSVDDAGFNALQTAVSFDNEVACRTLLVYKDRFDIDCQANDGSTAFLCAIPTEANTIPLNIFNMLLDAGCDPCIKDRKGYDVLQCLVNYGHDHAAKDLLDKYPDMDLEYVDPKRNETILMSAVKNGDIDTVNLLLEKGANPCHEMTQNTEYKKNLTFRVMTDLFLSRGNNHSDQIRDLNPTALLNLHEWESDINFSPLTCAMNSRLDEETQKSLVRTLYQKICERAPENRYATAISRFRGNLDEGGEGSQCPMTTDVTDQPVMLVETAQIYDKDALDDWLQNHRDKVLSFSNRTCPLAGSSLKSRQVIPLSFFE